MSKISRIPDFDGEAKAWKMEMGDNASTEQATASLGAYVVSGPYHPFWNWWMVAVVHLREVEGTPPPKKQYPDAEYEFMILSIDPEHNQPDPDKPFPQEIRYLDPPDCVVQFHGVTDEQAASICRDAVRVIAAGQSCDSDFRGWWTGAIKKTVEHYQEGRHDA